MKPNTGAQMVTKCYNNARMDMTKGNPDVTKIYFYLETEQVLPFKYGNNLSSSSLDIFDSNHVSFFLIVVSIQW